MKKLLFMLTAATALAFAACEKTETSGSGNNNTENTGGNGGNDQNSDNENNENNEKNENTDGDVFVSLTGTEWNGTLTFRDRDVWQDATSSDSDGNVTEGEIHYGEWVTVTSEVTLNFTSDNEVRMFTVQTDDDGEPESDETTGTYTYDSPNVTLRYHASHDEEEDDLVLNAVVTSQKTMKLYTALQDTETGEYLFVEMNRVK